MRTRYALVYGLLALGLGRGSAAEFSTEGGAPTPIAANGKLSGRFPPDEASATYYVSATTGAGSLIVRARYAGSEESIKEVEFALADGGSREQPVGVRGTLETEEQMSTIRVVTPGRHVFALTVRGPNNGGFCVLLGGAAFPTPANVECDPIPRPAPAVASGAQPAPSPAPAAAEPCERRIRFETDDLFVGSTATLRDDAGPVLAAVGRQLLASQHAVRVECDTDLPGLAGQHLSDQRAGAVREFLLAFGVRAARVEAKGFGATRLVVPGKRPGSTDAPENRRIEIVICPS